MGCHCLSRGLGSFACQSFALVLTSCMAAMCETAWSRQLSITQVFPRSFKNPFQKCSQLQLLKGSLLNWVLWSEQSPRLRFSMSKVPMPGTGRMSHVPGDAIFQIKGENSFLYSGGSQDSAGNWRVMRPKGSSCSTKLSAWGTKAQG